MQGEIFIKQNVRKHSIFVKTGDNLLEALRVNGVSMNAPCGGGGTCGKCTIDTFKGTLLACKTIIDESFFNTTIHVSENSHMEILAAYENFHPVICNRQGNYGIAIDIGTTTLAFEILNMKTGARVATHSQINSQREFGADIMTRITSAVAGAQSRLHSLIKENINRGVGHIISKAQVSQNEVSLVTITGNTTMLHFLLNAPCNTLGVAPFTPVFLDMKFLKYNKILSELLTCDVIVLPGISTFVGADISAGILCAGWPHVTGSSLLIDLGTNGEMALFSKEKIVVTSTAAGPAFEGGNISMGTGSVPGAIAKVSYLPENNVFIYKTINNLPPIGICGTGVVDISAELILHKLIDETGQIVSDDDEILIAPGICFTQRDIREIQLAKSAVRTGIEILLELAGISCEDLSTVFIAGGFGHKINLQSAVTLGLIPPTLEKKVTVLGNSALGGCAKVLLNKESETHILKLVSLAAEINLATHPKFNELFINYMGME